MNRYNTFQEKDLLHLSQLILSAYYNDELILVVIHGKQGYGKSTYSSVVMAQVLGYIKGKDNDPETQVFNYDWKGAKKFFVFKPRDFLLKSRDQQSKSPTCCVDDAGLWLNAMDYHNPLVKAVGKFLEVARTKWGAIIFTCSDLQQVFSKLRNMPHVYTIRISKSASGKQKPDRRIATIYEGWRSEDLKKSGRKTKAIDVFYAEMPKVFYDWYKPHRDNLADQGLNEVEEELNKLNL